MCILIHIIYAKVSADVVENLPLNYVMWLIKLDC